MNLFQGKHFAQLSPGICEQARPFDQLIKNPNQHYYSGVWWCGEAKIIPLINGTIAFLWDQKKLFHSQSREYGEVLNLPTTIFILTSTKRPSLSVQEDLLLHWNRDDPLTWSSRILFSMFALAQLWW